MSVSADAAITRWADIMEGRTTKQPLRASNVFVEGDQVFSYGHHFELARPLRDKRKRVRAYLLNGDRYSNTTNKHQSSVRWALAKSAAPSVILPYSALEAAGVDMDSVQLVHVKKDRNETIKHHTSTMPQGAVWREEPVFIERDRTPWELAVVFKYHYPDCEFDPNNLPEWLPRTIRLQQGTKQVLHTSWRNRSPRIRVTRDEDGKALSYEWETYHHWLGESLIKARVRWIHFDKCTDCGGRGRRNPYVGEWWEWRCPTCGGRGETARWRQRWTLFLSGFDHQEPAPLYFLCELPYHCRATTVEEAYEALKPVPVKLAEAMGRSYTRQGDIFAIPAPSITDRELREKGARIERRATRNSSRPTHLPYILGTNHTATEVAYLPGVTLARGLLYHDPHFREQDHVRRKMGDGKTWHVVVKNTVPISTRR